MARKTILIAIAGASGSGKTSLAKQLRRELEDWFRVAIVSEDSYYRDQSELTFIQREQTNYDHPDAVEESLLVQHLTALKSAGVVSVPVYDYEEHNRGEETVAVGPCDILILEGILILSREAVRGTVDLSVFVDVPEEVCLRRRIRRDVTQRGRTRESVLAQYEKTVGPMFREFVQPSMKHADVVVKNSTETPPSLDELLSRIRELVA